MYLLLAVLSEISVKETAPKNKMRIIYLPCTSATKAVILAGDDSGPVSGPEIFLDFRRFYKKSLGWWL